MFCALNDMRQDIKHTKQQHVPTSIRLELNDAALLGERSTVSWQLHIFKSA